MTVRATKAAVQVVHSGSSGGRSRVAQSTLQLVSISSATQTRVAYSTMQIVSATIAPHVRQAAVSAQVVFGGSPVGGRGRVGYETVQPVYTIGFEDAPLQRAWTFDWDGHTFYCLDLGNEGTLAYDLTTQQWTTFDTAGYEGAFNFKNGIYWETGRRIVGGDARDGRVYEMDPSTFLDEGWRPVSYEVRGIIFAEGNDVNKQYALRLIGSSGRLADDIAPVLKMRFSDDEGQTWSSEFSIDLTSETKQRLEFRSLGSFAHPGRIFRLYDTGGIKFIGRCEADLGN